MVAGRTAGPTSGRRMTARKVRRGGSAAIAAALLATSIIDASPAQAYPSQQWALDYLKANQDWSISKGSGVTVAVLDTGVASIPDLTGQVTSGADFSAGTTSTGTGRTDTDTDGHGTGMASVVAGNGIVEGLAPRATVLPVRVDAAGAGTILVSNVAAGVRYAVSSHVGVINLSLGFAQDPGNDLRQAITQAIAANIVVVAGTGNDATSVAYPAAYPGVVAVGAVDQNGQIWAQSNTGPQVTLAAPGVGIYRDNNFGQQGTSSGTSEATAYVSAAAALVRGAHPDWTAGQVIRALISTADPGAGQTAGRHSDQYGYGILDPLKALRAASPADTTNPLLSAASSGPAAGATADGGETSAAASAGSSGRAGVIIAGVVALLVILGVVLLIVLLSRRGRGPKPPAGPGGYPPRQPDPYQQSPYQPRQPQAPQYPHPGDSGPYGRQSPQYPPPRP